MNKYRVIITTSYENQDYEVKRGVHHFNWPTSSALEAIARSIVCIDYNDEIIDIICTNVTEVPA